MNSKEYVDALTWALEQYPHNDFDRVVRVLETARTTGGTIYTCGNGGSSATASHMVADFTNLCGFPAVCLSDNIPRLTATANDRDYTRVFADALAPMIRYRDEIRYRDDDVLMVFSGSGNSANVCEAVRFASRVRCPTIAITGRNGGRLKALAQTTLVIPSDDMQIIEDCHLATVHMLTHHFMLP